MDSKSICMCHESEMHLIVLPQLHARATMQSHPLQTIVLAPKHREKVVHVALLRLAMPSHRYITLNRHHRSVLENEKEQFYLDHKDVQAGII